MLIDTIEQDLKIAIDKTYQEMDSENLLAIISQMITDRICYSHHYSLSNYSLENKRPHYYSKTYLPNKNLPHFYILQKFHDQPIAKYPGVVKIYKIF